MPTLAVQPPDSLLSDPAGQVSLPVRLATVTTVHPVAEEVANPPSLPAPPVAVPLTCGQSELLSTVPPTESMEKRMLRLIGLVIGQAVQPIQTSINALASRLELIEHAQTTMDWDDDPEGYMYDQDQEEREAALAAQGKDHAMNLASDNQEEPDWANDIHPYFEHIYCQIYKTPYDAALTSLQELGVEGIVESWYAFTTRNHVPNTLPPSSDVGDAFIKVTLIEYKAYEAKAQALWHIDHRLVDGNAGPLATWVPALPMPSICAFGKLPSQITFREQPRTPRDPNPLPPPVPCNGNRLSPPLITSLGDCASAPIDIPSDSDAPPSSGEWKVMGSKKGKSFTAIAASSAHKPDPSPICPLPPTTAQAVAGFLTSAQLESMKKDEIIHLFNRNFPLEPRLNSRCITKPGAISAYLSAASRPPKATKPDPSPKPILKTDYTLIRDPQTLPTGMSGQRGDTAALVHAVQQHIRAVGAPPLLSSLAGGGATNLCPTLF